ncbi:hypothetical protein MHBO_002934 [Bonamia ostreae]|uniref:Transcription elongation factor 1 homolog n=1 Tax=Bonamia ostreae TaxID=126728 RepID=A0ABV2ANZ8_9EUKA
MVSRKVRKKPIKKVKQKVPNVFDCPFCGHSNVVECKIDKKKMEGKVSCRVCDAGYTMNTNNLTDPVDVFCEWVDKCHKNSNLKRKEPEPLEFNEKEENDETKNVEGDLGKPDKNSGSSDSESSAVFVNDSSDDSSDSIE